jgi:hypothetical protein
VQHQREEFAGVVFAREVLLDDHAEIDTASTSGKRLADGIDERGIIVV